MRAFTGWGFEEDGGNIFRMPSDNETFFNLTNNSKNRVIVELDIWEYTAPQWTQLSQQTVNMYLANGFVLRNVIYRNVTGQDNVPVIVIFGKDPEVIQNVG
jgi:hypothetical protein